MNTNNDLIYPELSYLIVGICFSTHNELGPFCKEIQYSRYIEQKLKESKINFKREIPIGEGQNIIDFVIENKIVLELKAKRIITKDDYFQIQRYLQDSKLKLGIIVNFRSKYLRPLRVVRIDTANKEKFVY